MTIRRPSEVASLLSGENAVEASDIPPDGISNNIVCESKTSRARQQIRGRSRQGIQQEVDHGPYANAVGTTETAWRLVRGRTRAVYQEVHRLARGLPPPHAYAGGRDLFSASRRGRNSHEKRSCRVTDPTRDS